MNLFTITSYAKQGYQMMFGSSKKPDDFQILDPMSTIIKMAIYTYMPEGTKLHITHNTIKYDKVPYGKYVQGAKRALWTGGKKDDIHNLHVPIMKAITWYLNGENQKIFRLSIQGLKKLNQLYESMNTPAARIVSQALVLNINVIKYNLKNKQDTGDIDPDIQLFESDSVEDEHAVEPEVVKSMILNNNEDNENRNHDIYYQLKSLWNDEEITLIINLFTKLEAQKSDFERKGYLDAIINIINGKDIKVTTTLEKITTSL